MKKHILDKIEEIADNKSFSEFCENFDFVDPLEFPYYKEKYMKAKTSSGVDEAVITGKCTINATPVVLIFMVNEYLMGTLGIIVGEKISKAFEYAEERRLPVITIATSGGARVQEGVLALMQMAKIITSIRRHSMKKLLHIAIVTDPTMGGVSASLVSQADIIYAESKARFGFAGKEIIKKTFHNSKFNDDFQTAEFAIKHGGIDKVIEKNELKEIIAKTLVLHYSYLLDQSDNMHYKRNENASNYNHLYNAVDYIGNIIDNFIEFHGDRISNDDPSIIGGIGMLSNIPVTVIAQLSGKNLDENIKCNFSMTSPGGYRKSLRLMKQAEKFNRPIICFIDTIGALCNVESEENCQYHAIGNNINEMFGIQVPIIAVIIGHAVSGGALALLVSDYILMLDRAMYTVISPAACKEVLGNDQIYNPNFSEILKMSAQDNKRFNTIDQVISIKPESNEFIDFDFLLEELKNEIISNLIRISQYPKEKLIDKRLDKFRNFDYFYLN